MSTQPPEPQSPDFPLDARQQRIVVWLEQLGLHDFAESFRGSVQMLATEMPGCLRFVSHFCRDVMNGMASAYRDIRAPRTDYIRLVDDLADAWHRDGRSLSDAPALTEESLPSLPETLTVSPRSIQCIVNLLREHMQGKERDEKKPDLFFSTFASHPENIYPALRKSWLALKRWFLSEAHHRVGGAGSVQELREKFQELEAIMDACAAQEVEALRSIDEILDDANSA